MDDLVASSGGMADRNSVGEMLPRTLTAMTSAGGRKNEDRGYFMDSDLLNLDEWDRQSLVST